MLQPDQVVPSTNLLLKLDVWLPLVTREFLQNTVNVTSVTYEGHSKIRGIFEFFIDFYLQ